MCLLCGDVRPSPDNITFPILVSEAQADSGMLFLSRIPIASRRRRLARFSPRTTTLTMFRRDTEQHTAPPPRHCDLKDVSSPGRGFPLRYYSAGNLMHVV